MSKKALIMVDLQNDFCPGGSLAVAEGDQLMPLANQLQSSFDIVIASQDWHPADHISFIENHKNLKVGDVIDIDTMQQVIWPTHCVQNSEGAAFHSDLDLSRVNKIIYKGTDSHIDSYSAFYDNAHRRSTGLGDYLEKYNIHTVYIMGLATDYCVKYTVLDALSLELEVYLIRDACRGVDLNPGDVDRAIEEMEKAGAKIISSVVMLDAIAS